MPSNVLSPQIGMHVFLFMLPRKSHDLYEIMKPKRCVLFQSHGFAAPKNVCFGVPLKIAAKKSSILCEIMAPKMVVVLSQGKNGKLQDMR